MKTLLLCIAAVLLCSLGSGCLSAHADAEVMVTNSFTSPNDIPGCPPQYTAYCQTGPVTVALPPFTQKIHINLPAGADADAYIAELDVTTTAAAGFGFVQELTVEVSAPGLAPSKLVDYKPTTPAGTILKLFPDHQNLVPYIEAESTTFTITITGTVPPSEVPLDVALTIDGDASYSKSL
jgi:hypothetical protein